jgi:hypothetical protein
MILRFSTGKDYYDNHRRILNMPKMENRCMHYIIRDIDLDYHAPLQILFSHYMRHLKLLKLRFLYKYYRIHKDQNNIFISLLKIKKRNPTFMKSIINTLGVKHL